MSAEPAQRDAQDDRPIILTLIGGPCHGQPIGDHIARTRPETLMVPRALQMTRNRAGVQHVESMRTTSPTVAYGRRWLEAPIAVEFYVPSETPLNPDSITLLWEYLLGLAGAQ